MTTIEPAEKLNNWSQLGFLQKNMVRYVIEKKNSGQTDWDGRSVYQEAAAGTFFAIERMNRNLAQGLLNIQYLIDPDVISLGGSISRTQILSKGCKSGRRVLRKDMKSYNCASEAAHAKNEPDSLCLVVGRRDNG